MGCLCSCLKGQASSSSGGGSTGETEMLQQQNAGPTLSVSRAMSAPSIDVTDGLQVSGYGLALANATIEQDSAYWELHVQVPADQSETSTSPSSTYKVMFGVATKKTRQFYTVIEETGEDKTKGTTMMRSITVKHGDTVGVAVQQSDLPMVQFLLNGEPLTDCNINRFRGAVYPSVFLPEDVAESGLHVQFVFNESEFAEIPPNVRFGPVIVARAIV